jgi:starch synthase
MRYMLHVLEHAVGYWYDDREMWKRLMRRAMKTDFSWAASARKYMELYRNLLGLPDEPVKPVRKRTTRTVKSAEDKPEPKAAAKKPTAKKSTASKPKKSE